MPKQIFFAYSYSNRNSRLEIYQKLKTLLTNAGFTTYSFVFDFTDNSVTNQELMFQALKKIDESNVYVAEPIEGSHGIFLEAGYSKAHDKKIIYLHKTGTKAEQTLLGIADHVVEYQNDQDILNWFTTNIDTLNN